MIRMKFLQVSHDIFCAVFALATAALVTGEFGFSPVESHFLGLLMLTVAISKPLSFLMSKTYGSNWRYAGMSDLFDVLKGAATGSGILLFILVFVKQIQLVSPSLIVLDLILFFFFASGGRCLVSLLLESRAGGTVVENSVAGTEDGSNPLLHQVIAKHFPTLSLAGAAEGIHRRNGMIGNRVADVDSNDALHEMIRNVSGGSTGDRCRSEASVIAGLSSSAGGAGSPNVRRLQAEKEEIPFDDLLGRTPVELDESAISVYLTRKRVLVTGSAGSIGSELCREVARFQPSLLVLVDSAETPLFYIEKELRKNFPDIAIVARISDVRDEDLMRSVFAEYLPEVVFHAAAYKHVPLMEANPAEAVVNNVWGTKVVADAADRIKADSFVLISSDKAVNPTSIMGATKRAAEIYIQGLSTRSFTKFATVRFGNVLGSNGSVIPIFRDQIRHGGPVTVTHREMTRYFMTIREATQLVLQAGGLGKGGEIFLLDMGRPVRILELAEELIRLSGYTPYTDIPIVFTGLRPGEKLYEELLIKGEGIMPTSHEKIRVQSAVFYQSSLSSLFVALFDAAEGQDVAEVVRLLMKLVPEYLPSQRLQQTRPIAKARPELVSVKRAGIPTASLYN